MRIFLDASVLFSAAKSAGAIQLLLHALHAAGHSLVADEYVATEARRNVDAKAGRDAAAYLQALLSRIEVSTVHHATIAQADVLWLAQKDRPVLMAAIGLACDVLVTGDRTHFGPGYGMVFDGVSIYAPVQLAQLVFPLAQASP